MKWTYLVVALALVVCTGGQQRVAPGVPPQHYQQQPMQQVHHGQPQQPIMQQHQQQHQPQHQQHQQQHQQYQQVPMQQVPVQQVPMQQQQQQQQQHQQQMPIHQQVPVQHGHAHNQPQEILNAANIAHQKAHIQEHMEVPMNTAEMTEQELQFHYFKMHDADGNGMLDGCELIKSLIHWHEQGNQQGGAEGAEQKLFTDDQLVKLIDPILSMDDTNKDGYIDYPEFIQAQGNAASTGHQ